MIKSVLLLSLVLLGAFDGPGHLDYIFDTSVKFSFTRWLYYGFGTTKSVLAMGSSCNACRMHEEIRAMSLEAIKEQILNKLGLKQAPNMTGRALPRIPPISKLMDMYGMQADQPLEPGITHHEEIDEFAAKTESVFAFPQPHQRLRHSKGNLDVLYFKFSDKIVQHRVTRAELSLWIYGAQENRDQPSETPGIGEDSEPETISSPSEGGTLTITLQRIMRGSTDMGGPQLGPPLTTKYRRPAGRRGLWVTIEVRRMVAEWFKHPRDNLGVAVKIGGANGRRPTRSFRLVETSPGSENAPYLEVQTQELDSRRGARMKRNVGLNCDEASQETRCCRYKLTVDFEKFGWDWIIAPKKYDANYCSGDCPMAFLPAYPNTHIVSLAEPPNNTGPCCAPRKLSEITMLYFDNEYQIVFSRLPGMVVERCGCS
ncbi:PREDICTED: growth/differentiation factor 8 isoform X2 [Ceratosolen solmsi marchali]|uniref:Growth/differentiation factor 8 isoform X2 n=1 Tax=Ceratosolen solmsi marchali TaxID=326594 RepID=A0AAJ6VLB4_9HYME|nr:PREDICTED: growth/differentiation factor 8 isoform X2 [Ceratosolen solmsi marchali]